MRRKVAMCLGTAIAVAAVTAAPAQGENVGHACVGSAVATTAHLTQQAVDMGLGAYLHSLGLNPGQVIQAYADEVCTAS